MGSRQAALACFGSSTICIPSSTACLKSMVLGKAILGVVVLPPFGPTGLDVPATLFITCPTNNNCGTACPGGGATTVSASLTIALYPFPAAAPLPAPTASGTISTAAGSMLLPGCSNLGVFNPYSVPRPPGPGLVHVVIPASTPAGVYSVIGTATVAFSDGSVLTQTGDTVVCLVPEAPGQPGVPRLSLELLTPSTPRLAPGDQHTATYRVINNDPSNSVTLTAFGTAKQIAVRPQGGSEQQGVFSISSPFGDDYPIMFNPGGCITLPQHPYTQPEVAMPLPVLPPNSTNTITLGIRSYGQCASGSCSESTVRVQGMFSDSSPALACAGMALFADTSQPTTGCGTGVNDCNNNGRPDAVDIQTRSVQDNNHNAMPDPCEGSSFVLLPNLGPVFPQTVAPGQFISVAIQGTAFPQPITNVWANGKALSSTNGNFWQGVIPADTRPGPQTVYFMAKTTSGGLSGQIGLYNVTSVGPPLAIQRSNSNVTVSWPNIQGPFILQQRPGLTAGGWSNVLSTFAHSLTLSAGGQSAFYRLAVVAVPPDPVDYNADRPAVAQYYLADPQAYWVNDGIPPLSRLADLLADGGANPSNAFDALMVGFTQPQFDASLAGGLLPNEFSNRVVSFTMLGQPSGEALINSFRTFVDEMDTNLVAFGTNAPRALQILDLFDDVFPHAFDTNQLVFLEPDPLAKDSTGPWLNYVNWEDIHGTDAHCNNVPPPPPGSGDTDTSFKTPWDKITNSAIWNTSYDAACAAVAVGASMAKLRPGVFPTETTCQFWNDISRLMGASTTTIGAQADGIAALYSLLGYSCTDATDGPFESAVEEACKALKRGCDVNITYIGADGSAHREMVEDIAVFPGNTKKAILRTLSWGQHEYVTVESGQYSGKTNAAQQYGAGSFLAGAGQAILRYYCKK